MADIEKVIKAWERCKVCNTSVLSDEPGKQAYIDCEYTTGLYCRQDKLIYETLELLKEQQHQIWEYQELTEYLEDKQPQIVRCNDCKQWNQENKSYYGRCNHVKRLTPFDWFCADGEKKE